MKKITIYTKFCVKCLYPEQFTTVKRWCIENEVQLDIIRTTYRPAVHEMASIYYGSDKYTVYGRTEDGKIYDFLDLAGEITNNNGKDIFRTPKPKTTRTKKAKK